MADKPVWGRTKIFWHQSHISRAGEAQTAGTGSTGLISEHIWDGIWVNTSQGDRGRKESDEYSQSMIYVPDAKPICEALRIAGHGKLKQITGKSLQVPESFSSCQWIQPILRALINFQKKGWVLLLALWSRGIAFSKVNNIFRAQLWSTSLIFREHRKCPHFSPSVLMDFLMSDDLSFVWHLNYSFSTPTSSLGAPFLNGLSGKIAFN